MLRFSGLAFIALVLNIGRVQASAQTLVGSIVSRPTGAPIDGAEVTIVDLNKTTTSSKTGAFQISKIKPGAHSVRIRRIGYAMRDTTLNIAGTDSLLIALEPIAELDSVKVVGEMHDWGMEDFERNRKMGFGHFFTRADIAKFDAMHTSDVLEQTAGLMVVHGNANQGWVQGKGRSASIHGGVIQVNREDAFAGAPNGCYATVYLDNARVYARTTGIGDVKQERGLWINEKAVPLFDANSIPPSQIEAMEFYSGAGQIPSKYMGLNTDCGVLIIHTRRPEKKPPQ